MKTSKRVTNMDVARLAEVSAATVSYVLNSKGSVSDKTRQLVLKAMQELGYEPNPYATRLRRSATSDHPATGNVGLVWTNTDHHQVIHAENLINQGVSRTLESQGYHSLITYGNEDRIFSPNYLAKVDGIILAGTPHYEFIENLVDRMPVVSTNTLVEDLPVPTVTVDDRNVGRMATKHLIALGHKRIAFISHSDLNPFFNLRCQGYREVMQSAGLWDESLVVLGGATPEEVDPHALDLDHLLRPWFLLPLAQRPTAVFAPNDELARAIYRFASRNGIRIPEDLSVVGCDNDPGISLSLTPHLTTVELPFTQMGERAAALILQKLQNKGDDLASSTFLKGRLIERGSCREFHPT